jgi:hypothetical protein
MLTPYLNMSSATATKRSLQQPRHGAALNSSRIDRNMNTFGMKRKAISTFTKCKADRAEHYRRLPLKATDFPLNTTSGNESDPYSVLLLLFSVIPDPNPADCRRPSLCAQRPHACVLFSTLIRRLINRDPHFRVWVSETWTDLVSRALFPLILFFLFYEYEHL